MKLLILRVEEIRRKQHQLITSDFHSSAVHRNNSFPSEFASQHELINFSQSFSSSSDGDQQPATAECYVSSRRKRFTRRQRHNLTGGIFGKHTSRSTSTLNKLHRLESTTSSSDNDNINERRKRSTQLTIITRKRGQSTAAARNATTATARESAFLSLRRKRNYVNSSLITRSTTEICYKSTSTPVALASIEPVDTFQKFKGPAARKAHRRTVRYKLNSFTNNQLKTKAESQAGLNIHAENIQPKKDTFVRRSVSVRELNGTMIDFSNQDSVTRWTSQILAEIDSLPSSSFDLTAHSTPQSSSFISSTTNSVATTDIISPITDANAVFSDESQNDPLKLKSDNNSFEMDGITNLTPTIRLRNNVPEKSIRLHNKVSEEISYRKFNSNHFRKFQKRNSYKKNISHQSMEIPETSCTAHIVLKALPSNRHKQSAHAIVVNSSKNPEKSENLHFLSSSYDNSANRCLNLQNFKSENNSNEISRLWRFLSRKKYQSFKKYLKSQHHKTTTSTNEIVSNNDNISRFPAGNSSVIITNGKDDIFQCNSKSEWRNNETEANNSLPIFKRNLVLSENIKSYRPFSQIPKLSDSNDGVQWRRNIDCANAKINRTCFSMESIDLVKENAIDDRLKFSSETKHSQLLDQKIPSPLTAWKRKVHYPEKCSEVLYFVELATETEK
ncbi:unnamed protein product [Cercopithifilaria johnstoni]|uniref:Uncharacterized protein n=1 Tax=Cercopithifilaria johnstoni TaxID=2874296 RepID=A0A8J2M7G1_9BILA|nr:unnamed protein product [Cercopithifilaria johnstoni]